MEAKLKVTKHYYQPDDASTVLNSLEYLCVVPGQPYKIPEKGYIYNLNHIILNISYISDDDFKHKEKK